MGGRLAKGSSLSAPDVIETLNRDFVPVEVNFSTDPIPAWATALHPWERLYAMIPWLEITFANCVVIDPEGTYPLGASGCSHGSLLETALLYRPDRFLPYLDRCRDRYREGIPAEARRTYARRCREIRSVPETFDLIHGTVPVETPCSCRGDVAPFAIDFGTETIASKIAEGFERADPAARSFAAESMGKLGETAAGFAPRLAPLLEDPDPEVREAAATALGQLLGQDWPEEGRVGCARAWWKERRP